MANIRAKALVGFYRGALVVPGQILELPPGEYAELRGFNLVELAPAEPAPTPAPPAEPAAAPRRRGK